MLSTYTAKYFVYRAMFCTHRRVSVTQTGGRDGHKYGIFEPYEHTKNAEPKPCVFLLFLSDATPLACYTNAFAANLNVTLPLNDYPKGTS